MSTKKFQIPTSLGITAPARSLTDSIMLPQGCLMTTSYSVESSSKVVEEAVYGVV